MKMAKEDLQRIRHIVAFKGVEMTPDQIIQLLREVEPDIRIVEEPGLVTLIKELENGDNSTG